MTSNTINIQLKCISNPDFLSKKKEQPHLLRTHTSYCLPGINCWISNRLLELTRSKIELVVFPQCQSGPVRKIKIALCTFQYKEVSQVLEGPEGWQTGDGGGMETRKEKEVVRRSQELLALSCWSSHTCPVGDAIVSELLDQGWSSRKSAAPEWAAGFWNHPYPLTFQQLLVTITLSQKQEYSLFLPSSDLLPSNRKLNSKGAWQM